MEELLGEQISILQQRVENLSNELRKIEELIAGFMDLLKTYQRNETALLLKDALEKKGKLLDEQNHAILELGKLLIGISERET